MSSNDTFLLSARLEQQLACVGLWIGVNYVDVVTFFPKFKQDFAFPTYSIVCNAPSEGFM